MYACVGERGRRGYEYSPEIGAELPMEGHRCIDSDLTEGCFTNAQCRASITKKMVKGKTLGCRESLRDE